MKTRKTLKKLLGLAITMLMLLSLLPVAALAAPAPTGSITVTGGENGTTVTPYRLIHVKYSTDEDTPVEPVFLWEDAVADWVRSTHPTYIAADNSVTDAFINMDASDAAAFYDDVANAIRRSVSPLTPPAISSATVSEDGSAAFAGLPMGNYLVLVEGGMKVYRPSAVSLIPFWNESEGKWMVKDSGAVVELKSSESNIDKVIVPGQVKEDTVAIGDTVSFQILADVPVYPADAIETMYEIRDTLPEALDLKESTILVIGIMSDGSSAPLAEGAAYTKVLNGSAAPYKGFILSFDYNKISGCKQVKVTYQALVNEKAAPETAMKNDAVLKYANDPYIEDNFKEKKTETKQFTYGIKLTKVDAEDLDTTLENAVFQVSASEDNQDPLLFIKTGEGQYRKAKAGELNAVNDLATNAQGLLQITGLDVGTWYLTEVKSPAGYAKLSSPVKVVLADTDKDGFLDAERGVIGEDSVGVYPITVTNRQGFSLPKTGGLGTILFSAGGVVLAGLGAAMIFLYLQKRRTA